MNIYTPVSSETLNLHPASMTREFELPHTDLDTFRKRIIRLTAEDSK